LEILSVNTGEELRCLALDGDILFAGGTGKQLRVWDLRSGEELGKFSGHKGAINCIIISSDGKSVITGSDDSSFNVWEVQS